VNDERKPHTISGNRLFQTRLCIAIILTGEIRKHSRSELLKKIFYLLSVISWDDYDELHVEHPMHRKTSKKIRILYQIKDLSLQESQRQSSLLFITKEVDRRVA
jgi:hypothetical protein